MRSPVGSTSITRVGQPDDLAHCVEAVVVANSSAPGNAVQAVPEAVGVLVIVGLPQALGSDVDVVVGRAEIPGQSQVVVALPEVGQHLLPLGVGRVNVGYDGLQAGGRVAGYFQRRRAHGHNLGVDRPIVAQLIELLDDGAAGELRLRSDVYRVGIGPQQLGELRPEVRDVRCVAFLAHHRAAQLLELLHGSPADALGVIGGLGDGRHGAHAVGPHHVAGVNAQLLVAHRRAEDVVASVGDVRVGGQPGEQHHPVGLGQRGRAQHRAAARRTQDDLHPVHVGQLVVGRDGVLGSALGVLDDEL